MGVLNLAAQGGDVYTSWLWLHHTFVISHGCDVIIGVEVLWCNLCVIVSDLVDSLLMCY